MAWSLRHLVHLFRAGIMSSRREFGQLNVAGAWAGGARLRDALLGCVEALLGGAGWCEATAAWLARVEAEVPGSRARLHEDGDAPGETDAICSRVVDADCALRAEQASTTSSAACAACRLQGRHWLVARMGRRALTLDLRESAARLHDGDNAITAMLAAELGTAATLFGGLREFAARESRTERDAARALTRELHDSVAQQLGVISFVVSQIQQQMGRSEVSEALVGELRSLVTRLQRQVRELITSARLTHDGRSLREAIAGSVAEFARRSNVVFEIDNRVPDLALEPDVELHVLQIVREALSNVVRHSHARHAWVELSADASGALRAAVTDDGVGLTRASTDASHHGLNILRERAQAIGAQIDIDNAGIDGGTRVRLVVPDLGLKGGNG